MRVVDVNVLVSAFRADAPDHEAMRAWLEAAVDDREPLGVSHAVLTGTVRVLTHPRVFDPPTPLDVALGQVATLTARAGVTVVTPGPRHWAVVEQLCRGGRATGNLVADTAHAAIAVEQGATWVSRDRDFARFPGLRWKLPA